MRLSSLAIIAATFAAAAIISIFAASAAVTLIEENSEIGVRDALDRKSLTWAEVHADGLRVYLTGTAPSEAGRFIALSTAGEVVDAARVIDDMEVSASKKLSPPRFSIEILRNDAGISLIGLIPTASNREELLDELSDIVGEGNVADLLEVADYPVPDGWEDALAYGLKSLKSLPRSKISIDADHVAITAMSDSAEAKRKLEAELSRSVPGNLRIGLDISAPRPVITPFSLRFLIDENGARFDSCSAESAESSEIILRAARDAGLEDKGSCTIGLGVPSPNWSKAAAMSIAALARLEGGSVTFADADITLVAKEGTSQGLFDQIVGELENGLPEVFSLHGILPAVATASNEGPPEFVATLSPEGLVHLRGRLSDELTRETAISFAQAKFGAATVHSSARLDETLPRDWPVRVLAGLDALAVLSNGAVTVTPGNVSVSGNTGNPDANAVISRLLSESLGETQTFKIDVTYEKKLDPVAGIPTPEECIEQINAIQAGRKIGFEPGSDTIDEASRKTVDDIADVLKKCGPFKLEIAGHTDSQGRESMNLQLSQARAQAVLNGLRTRRVLTSSYTAVGYGETDPIADNSTEDGREANRRIEFRLIRPEPMEETETTLESIEQTGTDGADEPGAGTQHEGVPDDTN